MYRRNSNHSYGLTVLVLLFAIPLSGCSTLFGGSVPEETVDVRRVSTIEVTTAESFQGQVPYSVDRTYASIQHFLSKELELDETSPISVIVFLDDLKVRNSRNNMFKQGSDELSAQVAFLREGELYAGFQTSAEGGGGLLNMTEKSRIAELSRRFAKSVDERLRHDRFDSDFVLPNAKELQDAAPQNPAPTRKRSLFKGLFRSDSTSEDERPNTTLRACTIEQVESMLNAGLTTEQIRAACE